VDAGGARVAPADLWRHGPRASQGPGLLPGQLPWSERLLDLALLAVCTATLVVALLYVGIGSLRFRRWLPYANAHARAHLGVLLALLALTLTWGAILDPAETVAGLHGTIARRALDARIAAARSSRASVPPPPW